MADPAEIARIERALDHGTIQQSDRWALLEHPDAKVVRKRSRTVVLRMDGPFSVSTEHGVMSGNAGDYLATNHPDDDASSDVWPISAERFEATYDPDDGKAFARQLDQLSAATLLRYALEALRASPVNSRHINLAITKAEEALLWTQAEDSL
jgi:hypothetical protein